MVGARGSEGTKTEGRLSWWRGDGGRLNCKSPEGVVAGRAEGGAEPVDRPWGMDPATSHRVEARSMTRGGGCPARG